MGCIETLVLSSQFFNKPKNSSKIKFMNYILTYNILNLKNLLRLKFMKYINITVYNILLLCATERGEKEHFYGHSEIYSVHIKDS